MSPDYSEGNWYLKLCQINWGGRKSNY